MSELRKDPVIGRWVIIATERARRPGNFIDTAAYAYGHDDQRSCPLCHIQKQPICTVGTVSVVTSESFPSPQAGNLEQRNHGLYEIVGGMGVQETVIETPDHTANMADLNTEQIGLVLKTYVQRFRELKKNASLKYIFAYKNYGISDSGPLAAHAHSHVMATTVKPLHVKEKLAGAKEYYDAHKRCVYCDLIRQEIKEQKRVIFETEHFIAVTPFAARFLFELWILPKRHHCDFADGLEGTAADLARMLKVILQKIKMGLDDPAYNFIIQTAPRKGEVSSEGKWETLEADYHWHIELTPQLTRMAGFEKGTGFYICAIPPEDTAEYLREAETP